MSAPITAVMIGFTWLKDPAHWWAVVGTLELDEPFPVTHPDVVALAVRGVIGRSVGIIRCGA